VGLGLSDDCNLCGRLSCPQRMRVILPQQSNTDEVSLNYFVYFVTKIVFPKREVKNQNNPTITMRTFSGAVCSPFFTGHSPYQTYPISISVK
jgi:hypothetical protein